jgi:transposase
MQIPMNSALEILEKNAELQAENLRLVTSNQELINRVEALEAQVKWFQKQIFGQKSERRVFEPSPEQMFLGEQFQKETGEAETQVVQAHERKKRKVEPREDNEPKLFFDESIVPVEEIKIPNPAVEGLSQDEYEVIDTRETYKLAQRPGSYVVIKYVREVVKVKTTPKEPVTITCPALPSAVFEKSHADVSFLAGMLIDKFLYHLPLYRQHQRLQAAGIDVSRAWLTQLVHRCGDLLLPIFAALVMIVRESRVKLMDETPIKAGVEKKGKMRSAYFWPVLGGKDIVFFYFDSREHRHVFDALGAKPGDGSVIVSDGYGAYQEYAKVTKTLNAQCWSHTRREFIKAEEAEPAGVKEALDLIRPLYDVEKEIREQGLEGEEKRLYRVEHSKPKAEKFFSWVESQLQDTALLPSSLFTKALNYAAKRKEALMLFLADPEIPVDTNEIERALRVIPMGRKNWLFCWTEVGAKYVGIFQSLIVTCKMNGIDPYVYLVDVLQRVATHPKSEISNLTPRNWKQHFADNPLCSPIDIVKKSQ